MENPKTAEVKKRKCESAVTLQNGKEKDEKKNLDNEPQRKKRKNRNQGNPYWPYIHMGSNNNERPKERTDVLSEAPREIKIVEFAQSRAAEIEALSKLMKNQQGSRQLSQLLPKHMRRRACSHNIKRLPRRVHMVAQKDYENQEGKSKGKRPSRKHRRRPKNLLQEYNRRQRKHVWLETHIWHAKRFKMANKWGYRIPVQPTDKSSRAAYRATQHHCQIQDISYMCCIDIQGPEDNILNGLQHLCSSLTGLTFAAKSYLSGVKEGQTILYAYDKYPYSAIGCVTFLWKPVVDQMNTPQNRQLWIWCHPSCYEEVWCELEKCFKISESILKRETETNLQESSKSGDATPTPKTEKKGDEYVTDGEKKRDLQESNNVGVSMPELETAQKGDNKYENRPLKNKQLEMGMIKIESLKDDLVRFRLTGPSSHIVLSDMLKPADIVPADKSSDLWWQKHYENENMSLGFNQQRELWECICGCQSAGELPPHCIMGLTVRDPRLLKPSKRTKIVQNDEEVDTDVSINKEKLTPDIAYSPLWQSDIREQVKHSKMSETQLNHLKSEQLIPGSTLNLGQDESKVPVLLIHRPGVQSQQSGPGPKLLTVNANYAAGLDMILPTSWSTAFWIGLIFRGARAGGVRESRSLSKEQGVLHFPEDYPDTDAGKLEEREHYDQLKSKYLRRPPPKRVNYTKLGIKFPFIFPWLQLVKDWTKKSTLLLDHETEVVSQTNGGIYVLRNQKELRNLEHLCCKDIVSCKINKNIAEVNESGHITSKLDGNCLDVSLLSQQEHSLVPVKVTMVMRGAPEEFAILCIPTNDDLNNLLNDKTYGGPIEPLHPDINKCKKKDKKKTKHLRGTNKLSVDNVDTITEKPHTSSSSDTKTISCAQDSGSTLEENVINSCSRQIIGFLKHGGFSLGRGLGTGVGFCSTLAMYKLFTTTPRTLPCIVLVRNSMSRQYRFAYLTVLMDNLCLL